MNKLTIIGNLTRDPEIRTTASGVSVCSFTVAVNRRNKKDEENTADYFRVTAWRALADICGQWLQKGKKVCVVGSVGLSTYTGNDGNTRASLEVNAEDVEFLTAKNENNTQPQPVPTGYTQVETEELPF